MTGGRGFPDGPRVALVTGASGGIGFVMARSLALQGFHVVMGCRDLAKSEPLRAAIETEARASTAAGPGARVDLLRVDFASLASVRAFADEVAARYGRLDAVLANAGTFSYRREVTEDGFERTLAVNYLGMALMLDRLAPLLRATGARTGDVRVVATTSIASYWGRVSPTVRFFRRVPAFLRAYAASKLAQVLFVLQFAEEMRGTGVAANLFHPGVVATGIFKGRTVFAKLLDAYMQRTALSPEEGAAWGIRLASASEYAGRTGGFYAKEGLQGLSRRMRDRTLRARFVAATREAAEEDGAGRKAPPP